MSQSKRNRMVGLLISAAGLVTAWGIYQHPEKLHAPGWVAYSVCAAFVIAGLILLVRESSGSMAYRWAVVCLLALMAVPPAWIALSPGSRTCYADFLGVGFLSSNITCRLAFGIGALTVGGMLVWAIREAIASKNTDVDSLAGR